MVMVVFSGSLIFGVYFFFNLENCVRDRTSELRILGFPTRHLGPVQMTTDTALGVTKLVIRDHISLNEIPYIDHPTIKFNTKESVEMPFRYIADGPELRLPPGMENLLHEDLNKSFDF